MSRLDPLPFPDVEALATQANRAFELELACLGLTAPALLEELLLRRFPGRVALVSSFGADSAVLLHLVAQVAPATPVLFLDTGKHFGETLRHRDRLARQLGLTDLRVLRPDPGRLAAEDSDGRLFLRDPEGCCALRKVAPLAAGLAGFDAWISGRKRFQAATRRNLALFESDGARIKVNPLAAWTAADLAAYAVRHGLPPHPLEAEGFRSIGCMPCTDRSAPEEDARAGRWRGHAKTECGIHTRL